MELAKLVQHADMPGAAALTPATHVLVILPEGKRLPADLPGRDELQAALRRTRKKPEELAKAPLSVTLAGGALCAIVMWPQKKTRFERLALLRKAADLLLGEGPDEAALVVCGGGEARRDMAEAALYVLWANSALLPQRKSKDERRPLKRIDLWGCREKDGFVAALETARANAMARELSLLPPNELTPAAYRKRLKALARAEGWKHEEYDMKALRRMGAGAFVAVAQGSVDETAAIVHLSWQPPRARARYALVGKGVCFDTGGHNLKPAKYMAGMHEDMNGSAVALSILHAAARLKLPVALDVWLAIAQNHISPQAYKQNEVVTALDGTTIEVVHTDAEGRMLLADALCLASGRAGKVGAGARAINAAKAGAPDLIVDFATLTGSMVYALGTRYSGVFATAPDIAARAVAAGAASGERVCAFPLDEDYEAALESKIADVKQCTLDGEADHILAARFLKRFVGDAPWLHVDLSAASCSGGLGAVSSDTTGFGVAWGLEFLRRQA